MNNQTQNISTTDICDLPQTNNNGSELVQSQNTNKKMSETGGSYSQLPDQGGIIPLNTGPPQQLNTTNTMQPPSHQVTFRDLRKKVALEAKLSVLDSLSRTFFVPQNIDDNLSAANHCSAQKQISIFPQMRNN